MHKAGAHQLLVIDKKMFWLDMTEEECEEMFQLHNKEIETYSKINRLSLEIKNLISEYNKVVEENNLKQYLIYTEVESMDDRWSKDSPTHIEDIVEAYSANPGWFSSSWCLNRD